MNTIATPALTEYDLALLDAVETGWHMRSMSPEAAKWWPVEEAGTPQMKAAEWTAARLSGPAVVIVWHDDLDGVCFGVVRGAYRFEGREDEYDASPFPGAWTRVPRSRILAVRSASCM